MPTDWFGSLLMRRRCKAITTLLEEEWLARGLQNPCQLYHWSMKNSYKDEGSAPEVDICSVQHCAKFCCATKMIDTVLREILCLLPLASILYSQLPGVLSCSSLCLRCSGPNNHHYHFINSLVPNDRPWSLNNLGLTPSFLLLRKVI